MRKSESQQMGALGWLVCAVAGPVAMCLYAQVLSAQARSHFMYGVGIVVTLSGAYTGYFASRLKVVNQYAYGLIELLVAESVLAIASGKLVVAWGTSSDQWPAIASLIGAVYVISRAAENIRVGRGKRRENEE
jgi:uncharacterized membrane protein YedE/YeeE